MPPRKRKIVKLKEPVNDDLSGDEGDHDQRPRKMSTKSMGGVVSTFFQTQNIASTKTVADLQLDCSDETDLRSTLLSLPDKHQAEKAALRARHETQFSKWWAQLRSGNSLLFYGFGSKHDLLQQFIKKHTGDGACLAIDGLQLGLSARRIVIWAAALAKMVKPQHYRNNSSQDLFDLIRSEHPHRHLYIAVHNIDGPGLRDTASQRLLSELAALPNVHVVATVDHVNAPLLWDMQTKDRFSWVWHNVTSFVPYHKEVLSAAVPSVLMGKSDEVTRQSAEVVLASLSNNAREVFRIIADAQLDPEGDHGITFQQLFTTCRERFLVSNEMLLRAFLTEFNDHDLLQNKRGHGGGGGDVMHIPLSDDSLFKVLENMEQMGGGGGGAGS